MEERYGAEVELVPGVGGVFEITVDGRLAGTVVTNVLAYERGARIFRVHDVAPVYDGLVIAGATVRRRWTTTTTPTSTTRTLTT